VFADADEALGLVDQIRDVRSRDGFAVLAWCVMPTHYHLALRTGEAPLWRSMRTIQGRFAQAFNRRHRIFGSLWQERYKCRLVNSERYLKQLLAYIHLNPVVGGIAASAEGYRWSGHRELLGRGAEVSLVDADEVHTLLGRSTGEARRAYRRLVAAAAGQDWLDDAPGALPWWRREERIDDEPAPTVQRPRTDAQGASTGLERESVEAQGFLAAAGAALGEHGGVLRSRRLAREEVAQRDLIALLAVERYGLRVRDLAAEMARRADEVSRWATRGALRRRSDAAVAAHFERLDAAVATIIHSSTPRVGARPR
jgi:REP element-mobilizing transposase RayT